MTSRVSEVIRGWLGWCPNAHPIYAATVVQTPAGATIATAGPEGGAAGGPGRIGRGINLAVESITIFVRNLRLLAFSLLSGLVILFSLAATLSIQLMSGINPFPGANMVFVPAPALIQKGSAAWAALTFGTTFISGFLSCFLLAALIICVSSILTGQPIPLTAALSRAGRFIIPLLGWAVVGAIIGCIISFFTGDPAGNIALLMGVNIAVFIFFVLTMFVVPAIVLDGKGLGVAILTSLAVFRRIWIEIIACATVFFVIVFALTLTALIPMIGMAFFSGSPESAGMVVLAYMLVMLVLVFIGSTIVGIATLGLYWYARPGTPDIACSKDGSTGTFP